MARNIQFKKDSVKKNITNTKDHCPSTKFCPKITRIKDTR